MNMMFDVILVAQVAFTMVLSNPIEDKTDNQRYYLGSVGNWTFYKIKSEGFGSMTSSNVNSTCRDADLVNTCVGDSTCKYSSEGCVVTSLTGCGEAMGNELSEAVCKVWNDPRKCSKLHGVYAYTPNWKQDGSACGVEKNNWCATGSAYANRYALCAIREEQLFCSNCSTTSTIVLKSHYNKYLAMKADKSFSAESKDKTESGIFNVEHVGRYMEDYDRVALKIYLERDVEQARYVAVDQYGKLSLVSDIDLGEQWIIEKLGNNKIGLKSFKEGYLSTTYDGQIYNAPMLQDGQRWTYEDASDFQVIREPGYDLPPPPTTLPNTANTTTPATVNTEDLSEDPCCQQIRISYNGAGEFDHPHLLGIYNFEKAKDTRFTHIKGTYSLYPSKDGWKVTAPEPVSLIKRTLIRNSSCRTKCPNSCSGGAHVGLWETLSNGEMKTTDLTVQCEGGTKGEYGPCVFPFTYNKVKYYDCTEAGGYEGTPWCAYEVDANGDMINWDYCKNA